MSILLKPVKSATKPGPHRRVRLGGLLLIVALAATVLVLLVASAFASKGVAGFFGSAGSGDGQFGTANGGVGGVSVATTSNGGATVGDVYAVDRGNNRIEQFHADGTFVRAFGLNVGGAGVNACTSSCAAGTASAAAGGLSAPQGIAVDQSNGNLYVTDQGNRRVDVFSATGTFEGAFGWNVVSSANALQFCTTTCQAGASGGAAGEFGSSIGYPTVDPSAPHHVYVADSSNGRVDDFSVTLTGSTVTGVSFARAFGWDVVASGPDQAGTGFEVCNLVANPTDVCKAGTSGSGVGQFANGFFSSLTRVAVDSTGAIYTVESSANFRVQTFTPSGGSLTPSIFDATDLSGGSSNTPTDVAVDPTSNDVYVVKAFPAGTGSPPAASAERRVLRVSSGGSLIDTDMAGAGINSVNGLALDPASGQLYVSSTTTDQRVYILDNVPPPAATVTAATDVTAHSATLNGTVTPAPIALDTSYQFQYSKDATNWTTVPSSPVDIGNGSSAVDVSQSITGLDASQTYQVRIVATTPFGGASITSATGSFTTSQSPPDVSTVGAWWNGPTALELSGQVNANNLPTTYYFQYGPTASYGASVPATQDASAGSTAITQVVSQQLYDLQTTTPYHFRLVATNAVGTTYGDDQTIGSHDTSYVYEQVTPTEKQGSDAQGFPSSAGAGSPAAPDGSAVGWTSQATLAGSNFGVAAVGPPVNPYVSQRGSGGWGPTLSGFAPTSLVAVPAWNNGTALVGDPDLSRFTSCGATHPGGGATDAVVCAVRGQDGTWVASPAYRTVGGANVGNGDPVDLGASRDLTHVFFNLLTQQAALLPSDVAKTGIYEVSDIGTAAVGLRQIDVNNNGDQIATGAVPGSAANNLSGDAYQAISADGSKVFFTAGGGIYARINGDQPQSPLDGSGSCIDTADACTITIGSGTYLGASVTGSKVFFTTSASLVATDTDSTNDLYEYDFGQSPGHNLKQLSAGGAGDPTPGTGANVAGVVRVSEDGSHVSFVASGVLTTLPNALGRFAARAAFNLYVSDTDTGQTQFVATLLNNDSDLWSNNDGSSATTVGRRAQATPDGRYLVFSTFAAATPDDGDSAQDVYRYDFQSRDLIRISHGAGPGGTADYGNDGNTASRDAFVAAPAWSGGGAFPDANDVNRAISSDGSTIIFVAPEALQAGDVNTGANPSCTQGGNAKTGCDVYAWHDGTVSMVSDGQDPGGAARQGSSTLVYPTMSASGSDVFFTTHSQLVPADADTLTDVYVARIGGGIAYTPPPAACTASDGCQGAASAAPSAPVAASVTFAGAGNVTPPPAAPHTPGTRVRVLRKTVRGATFFVRVKVPGRGRITITGGAIKRVSRAVARAETYKLRVTLTPKARRALAAKRKLKPSRRKLTLKLRIAYTPAAQTARRGAHRSAWGFGDLTAPLKVLTAAPRVDHAHKRPKHAHRARHNMGGLR